jgi:hypothetical protein
MKRKRIEPVSVSFCIQYHLPSDVLKCLDCDIRNTFTKPELQTHSEMCRKKQKLDLASFDGQTDSGYESHHNSGPEDTDGSEDETASIVNSTIKPDPVDELLDSCSDEEDVGGGDEDLISCQKCNRKLRRKQSVIHSKLCKNKKLIPDPGISNLFTFKGVFCLDSIIKINSTLFEVDDTDRNTHFVVSLSAHESIANKYNIIFNQPKSSSQALVKIEFNFGNFKVCSNYLNRKSKLIIPDKCKFNN